MSFFQNILVYLKLSVDFEDEIISNSCSNFFVETRCQGDSYEWKHIYIYISGDN